MKTTLGDLRHVLAEAAMGFGPLLDDVKALAFELFKIKRLPSNVLKDIEKAFAADAIKAGRLPTTAECRVMMSGDDEDEDVTMPYFSKTFSRTLGELEALWQLRGM